VLAVFELIKLRYRVVRWRTSASEIYISETNKAESAELQEEGEASEFSRAWSQASEVPEGVELKERLKLSLENLKKDK
jgi:hypothetical protein